MIHPSYSVIIPVFNSENTLEELFSRIRQVFEAEHKNFEVLFVEDGSLDGSWEVLTSLKEKNPDTITAIRLSQNYGQHNATFCGFSFAKGDFMITIDDDLQNPPEEIPKLIRKSEETNAEVVYGLYLKKQHSFARNMATGMVKTTSKLINERTSKVSSFRLINKSLIDKILSHNHNFIIIDEILNWYTKDMAFVLVDHKKRANGKSTYTPGKLFKLASNIVFYYTNLPLQIMIYGGLIVSFGTFLLGVQSMINKLFFDIPLGYTAIIVTIFFSTSIIVFSLGIIGSYISRIYHVQNKKPPYMVKKVL
jgi:glycosyltransferase involved in cell wall biosynthesis